MNPNARLLVTLLVGVALGAGASQLLWRGGAGSATGDRTGVDRQIPHDDVPGSSAPGPSVVRRVSTPDLPRLLVVDERRDLTGDGEPEQVLLYVDADRGRDGRILWDDGQRWALVVRAAEGTYPLFDEYVQIGSVRFWIVAPHRPESGDPVRIVLLRETGAGQELRAFHFQQGTGFLAAVEHSTSGNVVFTSPEIR